MSSVQIVRMVVYCHSCFTLCWALQMLFPSCSLVLYDRLAETQIDCKCAPYVAVFHGAFSCLFATFTLSGLLAVRQEPSNGQRRNS